VRLLSTVSLFIAVAGLKVDPGAAAQGVSSLRGVVIERSGKPVRDATVVLDDSSRTTNQQGRFHFDSVAIGMHRLTVRAIGYRPFTASLRLKAGTAEATVTLSSDPYRLPELAVRVRSPKLERLGFYARREEERRGRFIEGDSLQRLDSLNLVLALSRLHSFRVKDAASLDPDIASQACRKGFKLWVNGWEIDSLDKPFYLRTINPDEVEGVEIYEEGTVPLVFTDSALSTCVLAIWER
jgi:hypothetical protein